MKVHQHRKFLKTRVWKRERGLLNLSKTNLFKTCRKTVTRLFKLLRNIKKDNAPFFVPRGGHGGTQQSDGSPACKLLPRRCEMDSGAPFSICEGYILLSNRVINAPAQLCIGYVLQLVELSKCLMRASGSATMGTSESNRGVGKRHKYPRQHGMILNPHVYSLRDSWIYVHIEKCILCVRASDEIGRHARLRIWCRKAWEFESPLAHRNRNTQITLQNKGFLA
ncbi:MAG: hypothetical protein UY78_C0009G0001 [Parcubacteria group bacterium GW2011_GWA1_53_13]|nr:MAG: hypothetical protein UY78_C0009G0001 [Parcubacteria group bacterium GW2011_GWA1_53_13]